MAAALKTLSQPRIGELISGAIELLSSRARQLTEESVA